MKYGSYPIYSESALKHSFYSDGPRGRVKKIIEYKESREDQHTYNLEFGDDVGVVDDLDDLVVTNNRDREKVLATVAVTMKKFLTSNPQKRIAINGSTLARTRLYRMAIAKHINDFDSVFKALGVIEGKEIPFRRNVNYNGFIIEFKPKTF
jgi:hypothetical protein